MSTPIIGIRREDKNRWERRVPIIPEDLEALRSRDGLQFQIQPSRIRSYDDDAYAAAGAEITEDIDAAGLIFAVKEIPEKLLRQNKVYVFFAHVIKGQSHNMPLLRKLMDLGCTLVDYEKITDDQNRRLIFFGRHAGYAGMIETLWSLGRRLEWEGFFTPLSCLKHAYEYDSLDAAKKHITEVGEDIARTGLPDAINPLVVGFAGYGNVSQGAQEILDCLPVTEVSVPALTFAASPTEKARHTVIKVVFHEEHMVEPVEKGSGFELLDYYQNPEKYRGRFETYLPYLEVLVNAIYWESRYPRLVTRDWVRREYSQTANPRLRVIGDISCDIVGSIEPTTKATEPDNPCYVYDAVTDTARDGVEGRGPVVMAVDNLPCELPREASQAFSAGLKELIPALARTDWSAGFADLDLPPSLKRATIVHRGKLTPAYEYLKEFVAA